MGSPGLQNVERRLAPTSAWTLENQISTFRSNDHLLITKKDGTTARGFYAGPWSSQRKVYIEISTQINKHGNISTIYLSVIHKITNYGGLKQ